ncbi:sporulation protein YtxC [Robertmurraya korlensis]|uniref:sporulation protein YtxC n=1 Tax=Robertmurraya korlensis TaxID=519977 RepID=UPI0008251815|nr:sporulation protein YtxC [Robertmurraya korlensis]
MIEIIFQNKEDAKRFHQLLRKHAQSSLHLNHDTLLIEDKHIVKCDAKLEDVVVKKAFGQFIQEIKFIDWSREILKKHFCYEDEHEQEQILDIITSIVDGNRRELLSFVDVNELNNLVESAINELLSQRLSFSFDSFLRFRLRSITSLIERVVEVAIDEYKLEQDYQIFVHTLRDFLAGRSTIKKVIHLIVSDSITFFDEEFYELRRKEILQLIDRKLLSNHPVYIDSVTIAPLLSIAPKKIYLYTDEPEQPLVRTICNLFEERVVVSAMNLFHDRKRNFALAADENF